MHFMGYITRNPETLLRYGVGLTSDEMEQSGDVGMRCGEQGSHYLYEAGT